MPIIYLSPSLQPFNKYYGGGNEQEYMNRVADAMEPYLRANGIQFVRNTPGMSLAEAIRQSNAGYYDLHLALHSNAAPESLAGKLQGTDVYYYPYSQRGQRAAEIIADNFKKIYPDPSKVKTVSTTKLAEVTKTNAPSVLVELAYHDNPQDVQWLKSNIDAIARNLVESLTRYFGLPFISNPQPPKQAVVRTQGGNLNIRERPSLDSAVIGQAPNGSTVTVYGQWQGWNVVGYDDIVGYADSGYINS